MARIQKWKYKHDGTDLLTDDRISVEGHRREFEKCVVGYDDSPNKLIVCEADRRNHDFMIVEKKIETFGGNEIETYEMIGRIDIMPHLIEVDKLEKYINQLQLVLTYLKAKELAEKETIPK